MTQPSRSHRHGGLGLAASLRRSGSLVALAWRSLGRQRRRTTLLVGVVAYSTTAIVFFWGYTDGFLDAIFQGQARFVAAPVEVEAIAHHDDPDPSHAIDDLEAVMDLVAQVAGVQAVAPRLDVPTLVRSPSAAQGMVLRGVDPTVDADIGGFASLVVEGRYVDAPGEAIVGSELARRLDVRVGDTLEADARGLAGTTSIALTVVGVVETGIDFVDAGTIQTHIADAQTLAGITSATTIAVSATRGREQTTARKIDEALVANGLSDSYAAYSVEESLGALAQGLEAERAQILPLGLLFSAFAAVAVASSVVVSVLERTREFGVMMALGFEPARLARLVTLEAILASVGGFVVGAVAGYALLVWMQQVNVLGPIFSRFLGTFLSSLAVGNDIRTAVRAEYLGYAGATVALAATFAAFGPARTVRALVPSHAMRRND